LYYRGFSVFGSEANGIPRRTADAGGGWSPDGARGFRRKKPIHSLTDRFGLIQDTTGASREGARMGSSQISILFSLRPSRVSWCTRSCSDPRDSTTRSAARSGGVQRRTWKARKKIPSHRRRSLEDVVRGPLEKRHGNHLKYPVTLGLAAGYFRVVGGGCDSLGTRRARAGRPALWKSWETRWRVRLKCVPTSASDRESSV
jgi:hypothetical protein